MTEATLAADAQTTSPRRPECRRGPVPEPGGLEGTAAQSALRDLADPDHHFRGDGDLPAAVHPHQSQRRGLGQEPDPPSSDQWFGCDLQGDDVYARTIYGARASIPVGPSPPSFTSLLGVAIGTVWPPTTAGGSTASSCASRMSLRHPLLLGGILFMSTFPNTANSSHASIVGKVVLALSVLGGSGTFG